MEKIIEKGLELAAEAAVPLLIGAGTAIVGLVVGMVVYKLVVTQLSKSNLFSVVSKALEPLFSKKMMSIDDMDRVVIKGIIDQKGKRVVKMSAFEKGGDMHKIQITCDRVDEIKSGNVYAIV